MKTYVNNFHDIVEKVFNLPLDAKEELKSLLDHNIADTRRDEIFENYKQAEAEHKAGKLKFSSDTDELMSMLE